MPINLTTRKKTSPPKIIGSYIYDEALDKIVVRFSEAYQPEGHDYIQSFKVLRLSYWLEHHLLDQDDIATYETLQLLCERAIPFTLDRLAEETGVGKSTLRQRLDNLENAELLDIVKSDGQGQPNFYILRTPYFTRDSIVGDSNAHISRLNRLARAGHKRPSSFLDDRAAVLRRQIRKNKAKKLRHLARLEKRNPKLYKKIKAASDEKRLVWFKIVKAVGNQRAADIDKYIWDLAKSGFGKVETTQFNRVLKERIKGYCERVKLLVDDYFYDYARQLFYFYSPNLVPASTGPAIVAGTRPAIAEDHSLDAIATKEQQKRVLRELLDQRKATRQLPKEGKAFETMLNNLGIDLSKDEILAIAADYYAPDAWKRIEQVLRL